MRKSRVWVKTALCALAVVVGGASLVAAQEVALSNLALKKTYLKVRSESLKLLTSRTNIFSPTTITCPGTSGTCAARIGVSVEATDLDAVAGDPDTNFECRVIRGGIIAPILALPGDIRFNVIPDGTFTWIAPGLPLGSTTINVQCKLLSFLDDIEVRQRTLTIDVYKP